MNLEGRRDAFGLVVVILIGLASFPLVYAAQVSMSISTDKQTYLPSELVTISGRVEEGGVAKADALVSIEVRDRSNALLYSDVVYTDENGTYTSSFKLPSDAYGNYTAYGMVEGLENPVETTFRVGDFVPPTLTISTPVNGSVTNESTVLVSGLVSDNVGVKGVLVNGLTATISEGVFYLNVSLKEGWNTLKVSAYDLSDNLNEKQVMVKYVPPAVVVENVSISREETKLIDPVTGEEKTEFRAGEGNILHVVLTNPSYRRSVVLSVVITHEAEIIPPSAQFKLTIPSNSTVEVELEFATMEPGTYDIGISVLTDYVRLNGTLIDVMPTSIEVVE